MRRRPSRRKRRKHRSRPRHWGGEVDRLRVWDSALRWTLQRLFWNPRILPPGVVQRGESCLRSTTLWWEQSKIPELYFNKLVVFAGLLLRSIVGNMVARCPPIRHVVRRHSIQEKAGNFTRRAQVQSEFRVQLSVWCWLQFLLLILRTTF